MRAIRFRAWDKTNKRMYQVSQFKLPYYNDTLMQYTGLKDKNGKDSYWDDIVSDGINPPFAITPDYHLIARLSEIEFEVIGDIYSTPELTEEK